MLNLITLSTKEILLRSEEYRFREHARLEAIAWEEEVEECLDEGRDSHAASARRQADFWWDLYRWGHPWE